MEKIGQSTPEAIYTKESIANGVMNIVIRAQFSPRFISALINLFLVPMIVTTLTPNIHN
jgi:hypothetical protein